MPSLTSITEQQCGEFDVYWDPPSLESGGGPLTGFQAQMKRKGDDWYNCTTFLTNHSCSFKGLQSETEYHFRVQALNQKGASEWAWAKKPLTTGLIGKYTR